MDAETDHLDWPRHTLATKIRKMLGKSGGLLLNLAQSSCQESLKENQLRGFQRSAKECRDSAKETKFTILIEQSEVCVTTFEFLLKAFESQSALKKEDSAVNVMAFSDALLPLRDKVAARDKVLYPSLHFPIAPWPANPQVRDMCFYKNG
jgi:hypothetical protein